MSAEEASKVTVDAAVNAKPEQKQQREVQGKPNKPKSSKKATKAIELKTPKGTKDYADREMAIREQIFSTITQVFKKHGAVALDTPVFELKDILTGKYGEDSKLIYDLKDQGGEECSLRYDLTVPFARYLAMNGVSKMKRYHIAKVYRRDQPAMTKGRMREFYQCDYDIAGTYERMIPDTEIVVTVVDALQRLNLGTGFIVKINHRKILDGMFAVCGVPEDKIRTISSAVDKLDKLPWADVFVEMTQEKGLDPEVANRIGEYVKDKGGVELVQKLLQHPELSKNVKAKEGLEDLALFFEYAEYMGLDKNLVSFDMSLARGLDYYTGIIYEVVLVEESVKPIKVAQATAQLSISKPDGDAGKKKGSSDVVDESQVRVGSIAAGGRYDELVGMFAAAVRGKKPNAKQMVPCVGVSIGVERIFSILMAKAKKENDVRSSPVQVFIMSVREGMLKERMEIAKRLWDAGIPSEFMYKTKPRLDRQYEACDKDQIPWGIMIGKDEWDRGCVKVKNMIQKDEQFPMGQDIPLDGLVADLKARIGL
ncbi:Cytoplasmic and mitochondrial histidine tRNA synthetase [Mycoemilia scoparia]|uniref:Histidine--tRNA ligase, mitochondrial n=1 Tax=Mycoemilia scoparia TaxID=417184 RepID=A0A9W8DPX3_9FUNG|nr:Cytoplasmic and mitochondrial histidine tRNA synthetase [Mycoemilia scoparia]